jgi:glycosyltransferase involved in cell wall biosynthesis
MDRMPHTVTFGVAAEVLEVAPQTGRRKEGPEVDIDTRVANDIAGIVNSNGDQAQEAHDRTEGDRLQQSKGEAASMPVLSVVTPVYNESEVLPEFHRRTIAVLDALNLPAEIVYVNDGSRDSSLEMLLGLRNDDGRVSIVNLSRNFGKEIAVTAGLDHVRGEAAIVIDSDLQDPPEVIPQLVARWREGYDVVYAKRRERHGESWLKRATASVFYRTMHQLGDVPIPKDTGDFRLLNRRCLDALAGCRERRRFMKGLFAWIGFNQTEIVYDREPRFAGRTKWNYWRLWNFALEGITSFTIAPLKIATYSGLLIALCAFFYGTFIVGRTLCLGRDIPGYASLMAVILFLAGAQLTSMGIIGEYVGRIFVESKGRPLYLLDAYMAARDVRQLSTASAALQGPKSESHSQLVDHRVAGLACADLPRAV